MVKNSDDKPNDQRVTRSIAKRKTSNRRDKRHNAHTNVERQPNVTKIVIPNHFVPEFREKLLLSRSEERYLSTLNEEERKHIISQIQEASDAHQIPMRVRVLQSHIPAQNKSDIIKRLTNSCESSKFDAWVDSLLSLPFTKLAPPPIDSSSKINAFLKNTRSKMDSVVYGQHEAKDEIMRLLCQWTSSGCLSTFAIALEGPPGIGKTTFAKNVVANVMNRPFNFIGLGGATDSSHLIGHSYTYEGAIPGRISECLKTSNVMNPCFYFDELDKISKTPKGDEITNILVHLTDREQNSQFHDRYFHGLEMDISQSLFIFSYNYPQDISPVLLDRLNIIKLKPPSIDEKIQIAKLHLIPKALKASALEDQEEAKISDECIEHIIKNYTDESGVRNLEKALCKIISTIGVLLYAPEVLTSIEISPNNFICNKKMVDDILGDSTRPETRHMLMYT